MPAEFVGQARALRQRLANTDRLWGTIATRITRKVQARNLRSPIPRPEMLIGLARDWRAQIPAFGRFDLSVEAEKRSLRIEEIRAGTCDVRLQEWDDDETELELGVGVLRAVLHVAPHELDLSIGIVASVSLHALARRFQRGMDVSEAAVLADLFALVRAHESLISTADISDEFTVPVSGGRWVGICTPEEQTVSEQSYVSARALVVRTYLSAREGNSE